MPSEPEAITSATANISQRGTTMRSILLAMLLALVAAPAPVQAQEEGGPRPEVLTASFMAAHPDVKYRMLGLEALDDGRPEQALREFQRAARYADKPSQAMVADMLWRGTGTATDAAMAYVWMDLAAERGYTTFVAMREKFWAALGEPERERALREGVAVYEEFGDDVAKVRLTRMLERERRKLTGSRTGFVGNLIIQIPGPAGWMTISGDAYYADHYWKPREYFAWQDRVWSAPPTGVVDVGEILIAPEDKQD